MNPSRDLCNRAIAMQEVEKKASLEIRLFHYTVGEKLISGEGQKDLLEIASRPNPTKFTIKSELKVLTHYEHDIYDTILEVTVGYDGSRTSFSINSYIEKYVDSLLGRINSL